MKLKNYTSSVPIVNTISRIEQVLAKDGKMQRVRYLHRGKLQKHNTWESRCEEYIDCARKNEQSRPTYKSNFNRR